MNHIVESCPQTRLADGLLQLHSAYDISRRRSLLRDVAMKNNYAYYFFNRHITVICY